MPERVLITGGAGFLGSHLCDRYLQEGFRVICMDNLSTGNAANIEHLIGRDGFELVKYDVTNYIHVPGELDMILHFASPASPADYTQMPIQTLKVGSLGTHKALGMAREKGARLLLASTSEVYGDPLQHPQHEEYWGNVNPIGIRGVYDEGKRFAEALAMAYHRYHGVETRIARIFNTYGPRMRLSDGRALPTFLRQALQGEDLTVHGDGTHTRSFCYVEDMVEGIYRLSLSDCSDPVNLGNPAEVSVIDVAREILELTGSRSRIVHRELPDDDPKVRRPDTTRARQLLGWQPRWSRREGLEMTIEYYSGQ